jgi:hypothetical protein
MDVFFPWIFTIPFFGVGKVWWWWCHTQLWWVSHRALKSGAERGLISKVSGFSFAGAQSPEKESLK